jgi:hypothetical protein
MAGGGVNWRQATARGNLGGSDRLCSSFLAELAVPRCAECGAPDEADVAEPCTCALTAVTIRSDPLPMGSTADLQAPRKWRHLASASGRPGVRNR